MNNEQRMRNLSVPLGEIDVVLDTDAYNEILSCNPKKNPLSKEGGFLFVLFTIHYSFILSGS